MFAFAVVAVTLAVVLPDHGNAAHIRRAAELAEAAGHERLSERIRLCRPGLCYISQVQARLLQAKALLEQPEQREFREDPPAAVTRARGVPGR